MVATSCGSYFQPPEVTIENRSGRTLTGIVLAGKGFEAAVGTMESGESKSVIVRPKGESSLSMAFSAGDERVSRDGLAYLEGDGGYAVRLTVETDLTISVKAGFQDAPY